tara:strand:- start:6491 stop:6706 length:216 start_codon:yes stop_codon:yes gene_type:complete
MNITTYFLLALTALFVFSASGCSYIVEKNKKGEIAIEPLESIQKVNCKTDKLTQLEITKCEMEARLLELKY